jgi:virulence factor Mce-like protein
MIRRFKLIFAGVLTIGILGSAIYFGVRAAYGAFDDYYYLTMEMDRAGQQVQIGTDVRVRGVNIGRVADIKLVDRKARLRLQIEAEHKIPKDVAATVSLKTFLGAKFIDLRFDPDAGGPYLADGDRIVNAKPGPELEDALDDGTSVLDALDPDDVTTIISELATAARGHGEDIARGLEANRELTALFADTLPRQIASLEDFDKLFTTIESAAADLNALASATNEGAPVYASARAQRDLRRALVSLVPFSDHLSDLLILDRPSWDVMIEAGDKVLGVIAARPDDLGDLVHGLYRYVFKLGGSVKNNLLHDGSAGAGFVNFIGGNDQEEEQRQICTALPPEIREQVPICQEDRR